MKHRHHLHKSFELFCLLVLLLEFVQPVLVSLIVFQIDCSVLLVAAPPLLSNLYAFPSRCLFPACSYGIR